MKHHYARIPAVLAALAISTTTLATNVTTTQAINEDVIEITSTRLPQSAQQSIKPVTIIDKQTIQENGYNSLSDVLQTEANIQITTPGGTTQLARIINRGTNTRHTLILIDGIPVNQLASGSISIETIPLSTIESIEIIKGASSAVYGSSAIGGVINIITATNANTPVSVGTNISSESSINSWVTLSDKIASGHLTTSFGREVRDGIDAIPTFEKDQDGLRMSYGRLHLSQKLENGYSLIVGGNFSKGQVEYDGYYNRRNFFNYQANLTLNKTNLSSKSKFSLFTQKEKPEDFLASGSGSDKFISERLGALWVAEHKLSDNLNLITGLDFEEQSINDSESSGSEFAVTERDNTGVTLAIYTQLENTSFEAGARYDRNSQYGSFHTEHLGVSHFVSDDVEFFAKYATAFQAPTFNDLYFPGYSNPNLKPEESRQFEFGFTVSQDNSEFSLQLYRNKMTNRIAYDSSIYLPNNINSSVVKGIEFSAAYNSKKWSNTILLNLIDAKDTNTNLKLPFIASQSAVLKTRYNASPKLSLFINAQAQKNFNVSSGEIPGFVVIDAGINKTIDKNLKVSMTIKNLLDRDYFQDYNNEFLYDENYNFIGSELHKYNEPGRTLLMSVNYDF